MLKKINNKHSYDNKIPNGYVSHSFEPLPQLWSRINEIIAPKKRIRFSNKITVSRFEVKLPNINSKRDSSPEEPVVRAKKSDSIHTKASLLRKQKIMERAHLFEIKNSDNFQKNHHGKKKKELIFNDLDEYYEAEDVSKFDLNNNDLKIEENEEIVKNEIEITKEENASGSSDTKQQNDIISVDGSDSSDSDSENVVDLKREMIKKRFRKAVLVNKTISKLKDNNVLLKIKRGGDDEDEDNPFDDSRDADDEFDQPKSVKLKFGSSLSEDGNYTMLKCYEDMLCNDIQNIYPKMNTNQMVRTKTSAFIRLPRKFKEDKKSKDEHQINIKKSMNIETEKNESEKLNKIEIKKHKIRVSRQLERAMVLTDKIRQKKGQLITLKPPKSENVNLINAYQMWTSNWKKIFV